MSIKKKIITSSLNSTKPSKPDTIIRAGITANLKFTRGKQLVEHAPSSLIPDPHNPRPGEVIDEAWLRKVLFLGTEKTLCKFNQDNNEFIIPEYSELNYDGNEAVEESYNFLRQLALSIRMDGLIEPIEIFLADKSNDPDYFVNTNLEYGYVILEGHQRRLAALMADVPTITCIEITDESMLVKLKLKHRKLRRQLSENNIRKGLTVAQNFQIVQELLSESNDRPLTNKELSSIVGLNLGIVSALKTISSNPAKFPPIFFSQLKNNKLTFSTIRKVVAMPYDAIESFFSTEKAVKIDEQKKVKPRGKQGGAVKKYATFKVRDLKESDLLQRFLLSKFPEISHLDNASSSFRNLENILNEIKQIALSEVV